MLVISNIAKNYVIYCQTIIVVLLFSSMAIAAEKMESRYGTIKLTEKVEGSDPESFIASRKYILKINDKIIEDIDYPGMCSLDLCYLFKIKDADVLLISFWDGGNLNPMTYNFITLTKKGIKKSKDFIAPDKSVIKVKQLGNKIEVKYAYPIKGLNYDLTRPPVIYENGDIKIRKKK